MPVFKGKERNRIMLLFHLFQLTKISLMENDPGEKQIQKEEIPATKTEHCIS